MARLLICGLASSSLAFVSALGPCDIFGAGNTPCVAAHSTVRAMYSGYSGALYEVNRSSDHATLSINTKTTGGFADAASQDAFCAGSYCFISRIFDQSPRGNDLMPAPGGGEAPLPDKGVNASRHPITVGGNRVYGAWFENGQGYRNDNTSGVATGNDPETLYMVTSGTHYNGGCCFDYGNAEINNHDDGAGTMECVYFGNCAGWGTGAGAGPWVLADLENGLWGGNEKLNLMNTPLTSEYVTAMVKGGTAGFALKGSDATTGPLTTMYTGPRPAGYQPMKKQGALLLGIGGDNSDSAIGTFYEGCVTAGYSTDAADDAVAANIVALGYGQ